MTICKQMAHEQCPRSSAFAMCVVHFQWLLEDNPNLWMRLEAFPNRIVHFVLDLHSFQGDPSDIDWHFTESEAALMVVDARIDDPWASLAPAIHMTAQYEELRKHLEVMTTNDAS